MPKFRRGASTVGPEKKIDVSLWRKLRMTLNNIEIEIYADSSQISFLF